LTSEALSQLTEIRRRRPHGPRRIWETLDENIYRERLRGAFLARMAGCILGAPVEMWSIEKMQALAEENGDAFPPVDYWKTVPDPDTLRYEMSPRRAFTRTHMDSVPVDDDIAYTLLGLLIIEEYGHCFSIEDVGLAWLKYLPSACTAEKVALGNLKAGIPAREAAEKENPYQDWIGAAIRADPWGYIAPGCPEQAAEWAWRDGYLSHRGEGLYGEMFWAAAISAAFAVDDPIEALRIGLTEIPEHCEMTHAVNWALEKAPTVRDYQDARAAVDENFPEMNHVHVINNASLTVFGLTIGGADVTRVISQTVAMGLDNDCTAATAGSIAGAIAGARNVPDHWTRPFGDRVLSYLNGEPAFSIDGLIDRFATQARLLFQEGPHKREMFS